MATVIGICLGGGQPALGSIATLLGAGVLWCLRWVERFIHQARHAILTFAVEADTTEEEIRSSIAASGDTVTPQAVSYLSAPRRKRVSWDVGWVGSAVIASPPEFLRDIAGRAGVSALKWKEIHSRRMSGTG
jgi:putative Mg2+ transporter-C (MgtC) family protein